MKTLTILTVALCIAVASASSATVFWAAGSGGLRMTADNWQTSSVVLSDTIGHVTFVSSKVGWAAGPSAIYKTVNGGMDWTHQYSHPNYTILALEACSETNAMASFADLSNNKYDASGTLTTTDGKTWQAPHFLNGAGIARVSKTATGTSTVVAALMYIEQNPLLPMMSVSVSQDCGVSWTPKFNVTRSEVPQNWFLQNGFDMRPVFKSADEGVVVGWYNEVEIPAGHKAGPCGLEAEVGTSSSTPVANTTCGNGVVLDFSGWGEPAVVQPPLPPIAFNTTCGVTIYGAAFGASSDSIFFAGGSFWFEDKLGFVSHSADGGTTTKVLYNDESSNLHEVAVSADETTICAAGYSNWPNQQNVTLTVTCSPDGGVTWPNQQSYSYKQSPRYAFWPMTAIEVVQAE